MKANSNAGAMALKYAKRAAELNAVIRSGIKKVAVAVDKEQVENLSGSGSDKPGSYPVPVRKGTLRGGHGWAVQGVGRAAVFNTTEHAMAIHNGELTTRQGVRYAVRPRPFLDDAANKVDVVDMVAKETRKAFAV